MPRKIEFIESYINHDGDYKWNDNHGELVRCRDCRYCYVSLDFDDVLFNKCKLNHAEAQDDDFYCADGERKDVRNDGND